MDFNKIGQLIAQERKKLKLTQAKLAEKLFISEKTISKWENGNGVPDTNTLPKLCEIFHISINELLNGERISQENYISQAEDKLLELKKAKEESDKRLLNTEIILGSITTIAFLIILSMSCYAMKVLNIYTLPIILIVIDVVMLIIGIFFCLYIEQKAGYYECKKCGHKHVPTFTQVNLAMHSCRTRYMKCPNCNKRSWQKKVTK